MHATPDNDINPPLIKHNIKKTDNIKQWLWNMFSSGLPADYDLEVLRKIFLLNLSILVGSFFLILLGAIEFIIQDYLLGTVDLVFFFLLSCLFIYLRKTINYYAVSIVGAIITGSFFLFFIAYGGVGNTAYVWSFTYPLITIFLLGIRKGTFFSLIFLLMACTIFALEKIFPFLTPYDTYLKMRYIPAYLTVYFLVFITEKTREIISARLETARSEIEKSVKKLETTNEALREKDEQYRQIFVSIQDVYYRTNLHGELLIISPSIKDVGGYDPMELIGRPVVGLYSDPVERDRLVRELMKSGQVTNYEVMFLAKDGRKIVCSLTSRLIYSNDGQPDGFAGVIRDITRQKRDAEALKESEKRYRLLADNIMDNLWLFDLSTMRFSYLSPSIKGILGFTAEEAIGFELQDMLTPSSLELVNKLLPEELLDANRHYDPEKSRTIELEQYHKDGTTVWTEASMKFIYDDENRPIAILGVTRDISERKRLQQQLHKAQKMESIGLLAGGVAHDLNNVLSGIVSYPELILMNLPEDSTLRKPLKTMMESGLRATAIVQDLLTMARGVATANESLNLNDLIREYLSSPECDMLKQYHPAITIKTSLDSGLLNIGGSPVHVRKVIMNLVSNAAEAILEAGNITIATANRYIDRPLKAYHEISLGEYTVLSISDDGPGISPEDLERIFEPFYTKKKMGRSGTGLGLSVVWNVMQDHKGYIDVTTDENGTKFELYFPITRAAILKKDIPLSITDYKGNGEIILVVDDVESQREISCKILNTLGYNSVSVSGGEEAVEYLKNNTVDLILLDMIMDPGINGHETYKRIIKNHPAQKALIVSGFSETDDVKETQLLGAGKYIKKPLTIEKIGLAVKEQLEK
jgi:PAS domain S-box-containing protein